ncbi:PASTA domain-containing protein [Patulibacter defluvii]|uniref:PASTA domain-containing protein n=1 Tax=Patulibacter defluvii TaxID=3095358 RepID=UPI002A752D9F|nr:PASTA domain-containing protein [Patulibacter sp. DM4]
MLRSALLVLAAAAPGPDSPATQPLKVPSVTGLTVAAAERRLRQAGLGIERGTLLTATERDPALRRRGRGARRVTLQAPVAGTGAARGEPVALATVRGLGPGATLERASWGAMGFARGRLTLGALTAPGPSGASCARADHAALSGRGRRRTIALWVINAPRVRCLRPTDATLVPGRGWSRRTVAWSGPLDRPRPALPRQRSAPVEGGVVQPDRRHVVVRYWHGACDALASTSARIEGRRIAVDVRLGETVPPETACIALAVRGDALVTLPRRAPAGATVAATR